MKQIIIFVFILISFISISQNFPDKHVELLLGKELKVKEDIKYKGSGYNDFYNDSNFIMTNHLYPTKYFLETQYDSIVNKSFNLISFYPYLDKHDKQRYKLKLQNNRIGIVYYDYDPTFDFDFPFEVIGGLTYPEGFFCDKIEVITDKFNGETRINSPIRGVFFSKVKKGKESSTYLFLRTPGSTVNVNIKGVIILLENGFKIEKPNAKIDVEVGGQNFLYSTLIELNETDIKLLTSNKMTDYRLYIYDNTIRYGNELIEYIKCISKM